MPIDKLFFAFLIVYLILMSSVNRSFCELNPNQNSKRKTAMKNLFKKMTILAIALTLFFTTTTNTAFAASSNINSTRFSLYRWDGPMYLDVSANCSNNAFVDVNGYDYAVRGGPMNGSWRVWFQFGPRTTNTVIISCQSTPDHGVYWQYSVYYSGNQMRIYRTAVGSY